jgi:flavodoxin
MKTLVAFYSRTGNTQFVAEKIAQNLRADLCVIKDKKNREGRLIYLTGGFAALREKSTEIEVSKPVADYEFVVVGSPVWAGKMAPAVRKLLVANDFSDKLVAFFVTLGGNKAEKPLKNMKEATKAKAFVGELAISGALGNQMEAEKQASEWSNQIQKSLND